MTSKILAGLLAGIATTAIATNAQAESDLEKAIEAGATQLTADEIAERLTGNTVTSVTGENGSEVLVYYGPDNEIAGSKVGGGWSDSGFYAVTDRDQVCLGWKGSDLPRLRCMDVLVIDGLMHKYRPDGSLSAKIIDVTDGNTT